MMRLSGPLGALLAFPAICLPALAPARAGDQPQWGELHSRNMVSRETHLPDDFDPATGRNVKWVVPMGSETYAVPVIAGGNVLIGTNNDRPRDPRHKGDRAVLLCLDANDGSLRWQLVVPKLASDPYLDWPRGGIVSPPTVEGDKVYLVTNRAEVVCLDLDGLANGNDGPYKDEGRHMVPEGAAPLEVTATDADILWVFDMWKQGLMYPHDAGHASILPHGERLYLNTSNGVDNTHRRIRAPDAAALIALDKRTGHLLARDEERMGPRTFHCTWSSPALGEANGRTLIFFGGPDGVLYAFDALRETPEPNSVARLKKLWSFDCDPNTPKENVHKYVSNRRESPSNIMGMPVFHQGRVYVAAGGDVWWGKRQSWLKCVDANTGAEVWSSPLNSHCCTTPAIADDLVFITDCGKTLHCLDAHTGKPHWTHQLNGDIWASPLVADGKVYVGSRKRDFHILAAAKEKKVLCSVELDSAISNSCAAADGVLYLATMEKLYALRKPRPPGGDNRQ